MKNIILPAVVLCLLLGFVVACAPEPPPPPPEPENLPPPEPSPEDYRQQVRSILSSYLMTGISAPDDSLLPDIISQVQSRRAQLIASENGRQGLQLVIADVDESIKLAREEERWRKISGLCRIYKALQPENSRYDKLQLYSDEMVKRPLLTVTGFIELDNELYVFIDLFDPTTGETTPYRSREGEEFHERNGKTVMRLVRIVGNKQSIEVEYLPINYSWLCVGPKERSRVGPNLKAE
jgi:hypothetical protein